MCPSTTQQRGKSPTKKTLTIHETSTKIHAEQKDLHQRDSQSSMHVRDESSESPASPVVLHALERENCLCTCKPTVCVSVSSKQLHLFHYPLHRHMCA
mmetsp:Transcript_18218/g.36745  ORF Transcript_18218/g.36745 Transcript_18218/m.36745 type:complete len:98 (+) Transcript_18218:157-450(+)